MNYIYTSSRNNRRYILNPELTMGSKVCLIDMITCEDKFVSVKTLKRWYTRDITEDAVVQLKAFTGMNIGLFQVKFVNGVMNIRTKAGKWLEFNSEGVQTNCKNSRFANRIGTSYDFMWSSLEWALS